MFYLKWIGRFIALASLFNLVRQTLKVDLSAPFKNAIALYEENIRPLMEPLVELAKFFNLELNRDVAVLLIISLGVIIRTISQSKPRSFWHVISNIGLCILIVLIYEKLKVFRVLKLSTDTNNAIIGVIIIFFCIAIVIVFAKYVLRLNTEHLDYVIHKYLGMRIAEDSLFSES